jgi:hypothetical protein
LAFQPGGKDVYVTAIDTNTWRQPGGILRLANTTHDGYGFGNKVGSKILVDEAVERDYYLRKAGGMGDIELLCDPAPIEIGNRVWEDKNRNGIQDPDEKSIGSIKVELYQNNNKVGETSTTAKGLYYFGGKNNVGMLGSNKLQPFTDYQIRIWLDQAALVGKFPTQQDANPSAPQSDDLHDNDGDNEGLNGGYSTIAYTTGGPGHNDHTLDFGFYPTVAIGSVVWNDINNNGIQDAGESGIAKATVTLLNENGVPVSGVQSVTTDSSGKYCFCHLPEGKYKVQVTPPAGYIPSTTQTTTEDDKANDSNIAHNNGNGTYTSATFTLEAGKEPANESGGLSGSDTGCGCTVADTSSNATVDFGFRPTGSWSGNVSKDTDNDDIGNEMLAGVTLALYTDPNGDGDPSDGKKIGSIETDSKGFYVFKDLLIGDYVVVETQPDGLIDVVENEGGDDGDRDDNNINNAIAGHVDINEIDTHNDFVEEDPAKAYRIGDLFWIDSSENGVFDKDEVVIDHAKIELLDNNESYISETKTNALGHYFFDVPAGKYKVRFFIPDKLLKKGYYFVSPKLNKSGVLAKAVEVGPGFATKNLTLDAAIGCPCSHITTDGIDAFSFASLSIMFLLTILGGWILIRREEVAAAA